jgi:hypothetical protein
MPIAMSQQTRNASLWLLAALFCACVGVSPAISQPAIPSQICESQLPPPEDGEGCEGEALVISSARREVNRRFDESLKRRFETTSRPHRVMWVRHHRMATVGHRLANGLLAPLRL